MKQIRLIPDPPFYNSVDVSVMDFPAGPDGAPRRRCKITVEFAEVDVRALQAQGLDYDGALTYYRDWLYQVVKVHLAQDWECIGGMEDVFVLIRDALARYYRL